MGTESDRFDVVIIGAGPGGYVCAIRCAQLGLRVACVEKDSSLGGTCLNVGCIPSKALLESSERYDEATQHFAEHGVRVGEVSFDLGAMMKRKEAIVGQLTGGIAGLFKKNKIKRVLGRGRILDATRVRVSGDKGDRILEAGHIVIATGSEPTPLRGIDFDGERLISSTEALALGEVPEHLIVVGAGVIGLELGSVWRRLGARVTVLEYLDRILPGIDKEVAKAARKAFVKQGMDFVLGAKVHTAVQGKGSVTLRYDDRAGETCEITGDRILIAIGRKPYTAGLGCEEAGIELDGRGRVVVDEHLETTLPGVYAIGDVVEGLMLAHKASDEGILVAERLGGGHGHLCYEAIPGIVYTHPEVAAVGRTEEQLEEAGVPYRKGKYRYASNGRALGMGERDGLVKLLAHKETDRLLGAHIFGARAGDLIAELALAIEFGASAEDVALSVHAHPTLAEMVREAAMDVAGRAIHK